MIKKKKPASGKVIINLISAAAVFLIISFSVRIDASVEIARRQTGGHEKFQSETVIPQSDTTAMKYIYNAPESASDSRYEYQWEILKTALEKTGKKYGPYIMEPAQFMTEKRQAYEMKNSSGRLTVIYLDATADLEKSLIPIRIPVDKGLAGYRLFLIRKEDQTLYDKIKSMRELKKLTYGLGYQWIDVDILRSNSFKVVTGTSYEGLFKMLVNKRFDLFLRSSGEILDEYESHKEKIPDLKIEDNIMLYYPLPMYFYFCKNKEGEQLAKRIEEGMLLMMEDGSYDRIFKNYYGSKIDRLNLKSRRLFKISNPFVTPATPFGNKRFWFEPDKGQ